MINFISQFTRFFLIFQQFGNQKKTEGDNAKGEDFRSKPGVFNSFRSCENEKVEVLTVYNRQLAQQSEKD